MADSDLLFSITRRDPALIFGETAAPPSAGLDVACTLPPLSFAASSIPDALAVADCVMPGVLCVATCAYDARAARPLTNAAQAPWQVASRAGKSALQDSTRGVGAVVETIATHESASPARLPSTGVYEATLRLQQRYAADHGEAIRTTTSAQTKVANTDHANRPQTRVRYADAVRTPVWREARSGNADRSHRPIVAGSYASADRAHRTSATRHSKAESSRFGTVATYQPAMRPLPGMSSFGKPDGTKPKPAPCYVPSPNLLFVIPADRSGTLRFACDKDLAPEIIPDGLVTVPIRKAYIVVNNASLCVAGSSVELPCYGFALQLDADSWTWGFSATLHASAMTHVVATGGDGPVELLANINGIDFRLYAENIARDRQFSGARINVGGRGAAAVLDSPYAPILPFTNTEARTAQQLMDDVLKVNGVSLGWDVQWGLPTWSVPAGGFVHSGSYMSALTEIIGSVGGYLQPHPTAKTLFAKSRYPYMPWEWGGVQPDIVLPVDVTTREGIVWENRPEYNGVYVSGTSTGVLADVKRAGTAGTFRAPMAAHPLLTEEPACRERGRAILGAGGRIARITLELPVLPETGIITPGKFVRYNDGSKARTGMVRGVQVSVAFPVVRQRIEVETHGL